MGQCLECCLGQREPSDPLLDEQARQRAAEAAARRQEAYDRSAAGKAAKKSAAAAAKPSLGGRDGKVDISNPTAWD